MKSKNVNNNRYTPTRAFASMRAIITRAYYACSQCLNVHNLGDDLIRDGGRLGVDLGHGILLSRVERRHRRGNLRINFRLGLFSRRRNVSVHLRLHRRDFLRDFSARVGDNLLLLSLRCTGHSRRAHTKWSVEPFRRRFSKYLWVNSIHEKNTKSKQPNPSTRG